MKRTVIAGLALAASAGLGYAAGVANVPDISTLNQKAFKYVLPDNIKWGPAAGLTGTDAYTLVSANFGVKWNGGKVVTSLKGTNLTNEDIQQHVFGDILKRSVSAEVRVKL